MTICRSNSYLKNLTITYITFGMWNRYEMEQISYFKVGRSSNKMSKRILSADNKHTRYRLRSAAENVSFSCIAVACTVVNW